jgi:hypothetical protein
MNERLTRTYESEEKERRKLAYPSVSEWEKIASGAKSNKGQGLLLVSRGRSLAFVIRVRRWTTVWERAPQAGKQGKGRALGERIGERDERSRRSPAPDRKGQFIYYFASLSCNRAVPSSPTSLLSCFISSATALKAKGTLQRFTPARAATIPLHSYRPFISLPAHVLPRVFP